MHRGLYAFSYGFFSTERQRETGNVDKIDEGMGEMSLHGNDVQNEEEQDDKAEDGQVKLWSKSGYILPRVQQK